MLIVPVFGQPLISLLQSRYPVFVLHSLKSTVNLSRRGREFGSYFRVFAVSIAFSWEIDGSFPSRGLVPVRPDSSRNLPVNTTGMSSFPVEDSYSISGTF
jgi:hypothetical protein